MGFIGSTYQEIFEPRSGGNTALRNVSDQFGNRWMLVIEKG